VRLISTPQNISLSAMLDDSMSTTESSNFPDQSEPSQRVIRIQDLELMFASV
jgi:hypothetical protein